jgi:hypothetical protein
MTRPHVFVLPADNGPCGYYRLRWPAEALSDRFDIEIADRTYYDPFSVGADIFVMQRPIHRRTPMVIRGLRAQGTAVVVDMDDDLSCVHVKNPSYAISRDMHHIVEEACESATMVTVTTDALATRYNAGAVLPNCIPESYLKVPHKDSALVGWGGKASTHPGDLEVMGDAISRLNSPFLNVGPGDRIARVLGVKQAFNATGHLPLAQWPSELARIGVGVAPLANTPFNEAKSWLRPLEYSAVGVPWVASPTTPYRAFHEQGAGLLADSPSDWHLQLHRLQKDKQMRWDLADAGRELARAWTIEANAHTWGDAWQAALDKENSK